MGSGVKHDLWFVKMENAVEESFVADIAGDGQTDSG
jgi:hypothetical protein